MASTYLTRTQGSATNQKKGTFSFWIKRTAIGSNQRIVTNYNDSNNYGYLRFNSSDQLQHYVYGGGSTIGHLITERVFRDVSAWYNIILAIDTTESTAADRIKIYVNGVQETVFGTNTIPSQNTDHPIFASGTHYIGRHSSDSHYFDGLMSHVNCCDGTALAPTVFGSTDSTTGEWKITTSPSLTYGNNGYFILKDGNSVTDQSGNGNNFTVAGGTLTKTEDNPSNVFATLNTLATDATLSNGNTTAQHSTSGDNYQTSPSTLGMTSGKYYCECKVTADSNYPSLGIATTDSIEATKLESDWLGETSNSYGYYLDGEIYYNGSVIISSLATFATNDIVGMALDLDSTQNTLKFYKNGTLVHTQNLADTPQGWFFATTNQATRSSGRSFFNFGNGYFGTTAVSSAGTNASGNGIFEYDVPTGYTALSTKGLNL